MLPFIDEHTVPVAATREVTWSALQEVLEHAGPGWFSRLLGCVDTRASGPRPFAVGSTVPGFHVVGVQPEAELALEGSHHFSTYALAFHLEPVGAAATSLTAQSRGIFPGVLGWFYRTALMRLGLHAAATRRILRDVAHRAAGSSSHRP